MINFPKEFVKTRVPGYFWSVDEQWLYSIKSGTIKFLSKAKFMLQTRRGTFNGWVVSDKGKHVYLSDEYLRTLNNDQILTQELVVIRKTEPKLKYKAKHYKNKKYALDSTRQSLQ